MTALLTLAAVIVALTIAGLLSLVVSQHRALCNARARLAVFTGPLKRDDKGRWVSRKAA